MAAKQYVRSALLCACSFYVNMVSFGMSLSFGVIYLELQVLFQGSRSDTIWVQSLFTGVLLSVGIVSGPIVKTFGCKKGTITGCVILTLALIVCVFTPSLGILYVTFVVAGIGASLMNTGATTILIQNFDKWRSVCVGIGGTGISIGPMVLSQVTYYCIQGFGIRGTFFILAAMVFQAIVPAFLFGTFSKGGAVQHKFAARRQRKAENRFTWSRLKQTFNEYFGFFSVGFISCGISMALAATSLVFPFFMFSDFAVSRGLSMQQASIVASCIGFGSVTRASFPFLRDIMKFDIMYLFIVPQVLLGALQFISSLQYTFAGFVIMAVLIGMTAAVPLAVLPVIAADLAGVEKAAVAFGTICFMQAIPAIVGPPLAGWIVDTTGNYDGVLYLCGSLLLLSTIFASVTFILKRREKAKKAWIDTESSDKHRVNTIYLDEKTSRDNQHLEEEAVTFELQEPPENTV